MRINLVNVGGFSLLIFLAFGPVYWFGSISPGVVKPILYVFLLMFFISSSLRIISNRLVFKSNSSFNFFEVALLISLMFISSVFNDNFDSFIARTIEFIFIFILIKAIISDELIFSYVKNNLWKIGCVIFLLSPIIIMNYLMGMPNWYSPFEVDGRFPPLYFVGFSGSRTGWSLAISLIYPIFLISGYEYFKTRRVLVLISIALYLAAVAIPSGRTGIVVCLFNSVGIIYLYFRNSIISILFGFLCLLSTLYFFLINAELFRLSSVIDGGAISSGRYEGNIIAMNLFTSSPFFGVGKVDLINHGLSYSPIHNLWLGFATEYGLFSFLALFYIFVVFFLRTARSFYKYNWVELGAFISVLNGIVFTMVEPGGILGQLKLQMIFWVSIGILVKRNDQSYIHSQQRKHS
ncbi:hypothetical protein P7M36_18455 [Vibrio parahaemolyticus]|uniref:O-antigen ligase family protein n=1 Tax=Vibrio harveyi group TaxID=717610 RepID=UPI00111DA17D|nr:MULTISPECIES: hypothetical protein [Vibrio harveyi group]MCZ0741658.1 hypothetical protein [Vibrio diabolicus]MDG2636735.1 hypothetical protein [Vibrio parahaemolyticus]TOD51954.1 hypothetical protein CGJ63_13800 [Vibrio parahaemolyticus]TOD73541.1 hypothetical protein CGJ58_24005 [Vibrio parahaemolyticus]HCH1216699.1 hypothetical protein [Vibrio parahaemolyticus]